MKRKVIPQGLGGLTLYLPKKWAKKKNLKPGDEVDISESRNNLIISLEKYKKQDSTIELDLRGESKYYSFMIMISAYIAGFDTLIVKYEKREKDLTNWSKRALIGFEVFKTKENVYSIETVSEPNIGNFENIIRRKLFIIKEMFSKIGEGDLLEEADKVRQYEYFLKRSISKGLFSELEDKFMWEFVGNLSMVALFIYHLNQNIEKYKLKLDDSSKEMIDEIKDLFELLRLTYFTKNAKNLSELHRRGKDLMYEKGLELIDKNPKVIYHLLLITKRIYYELIPLTGKIYMKDYAHS
jgi:bifunctional DNA-binding transcriptional regulator/antitoxin component of YhaV-PrlF toxin-antitoxin module